MPPSVPCSLPRVEGVGSRACSRMSLGWACQTLLRAAQHPKPPQAQSTGIGDLPGVSSEPREILNHSHWTPGPVVEDFLLSLSTK